jgi:hypothetical protein
MANLIEFTRGDGAYHFFAIPTSSWVPGCTLFFAAKPAIDDDLTDAAAIVQQQWNDSVVVDIPVGGLLGDGVTVASVPMKQYTCTFPPSATNSIVSNGADQADYLGEFQLVPPNGIPITFPAKPPKLDVAVYFDIKRETS